MVLEIPMPKAVLNCSFTPSQGKYSFDPVSRTLVWDVGRIDTTRLPNIRGTVSINFAHLHTYQIFFLKSNYLKKKQISVKNVMMCNSKK